jgi:hypothetical protein
MENYKEFKEEFKNVNQQTNSPTNYFPSVILNIDAIINRQQCHWRITKKN